MVDAAAAPRFLNTWPEAFAAPLRHPLDAGGKRIRPLVVLAMVEAFGGVDAKHGMHAAIALELVHTYSLVHDDLPAMDDDDERRGQPTVHKAWDEATAILVGDALLTEAFHVLTESELSAEAQVAQVAELSRAAGHLGMVGGQAADVGIGDLPHSLEVLTRLHAGKTGALFEAAAVMGALAALGTHRGADTTGTAPLRARLKEAAATTSSFRRYGAAIGLAFQLADDVLDADEDAHSDGPPSFVKLLGEAETRRRAEALAAEAEAAISHLPQPQRLIDLARAAVHRSH